AAVAKCLLGVFAGVFLKRRDLPAQRKVFVLAAAGLVCLAAGFGWGLAFPIIKLLWTSSYVLVACGYGAILLALFIQLIDVWQFRRWSQPFVWIGMNALTIYILGNIVNFHRLALRFVSGDIARALGNYAALAQAVLGTLLGLSVV